MAEFDRIWESLPSFRAEPEERLNYCTGARDFKRLCDQMLGPLEGANTVDQVRKKKADLQDMYWFSSRSAERAHRDYTGARHVCIYHVYMDYLSRLQWLQMKLAVLKPEASPTKQVKARPRLPSITLGLHGE